MIRLFPLSGAFLFASCVLFGCAAQSKPRATKAVPQEPKMAFEQDSKKLDEVSGIAQVRGRRDLFWVHNDSGDTARMFVINDKGKLVLTVNLEGANAFDWEDCDAQGGYVYAGDIGDNLSFRRDIQIYRFRVPKFDPKKKDQNITLSKGQWEQTTLRYPDGAHNCESLVATPDGRLLLVSKEESGTSRFYVWNTPWKNGASATLSKIGQWTWQGKDQFSKLATGADISSDGRKLVVTTYTALYEFPLMTPFDFSSIRWVPTIQALPAQKQCEAVCYSLDGRTIYSTGEGKKTPVWVLASRLP